MKVMIASPAYSGKVNIPFCISYAETAHLLRVNNIEIQTLIVTSGSLLVAERNRLIEAFWNSDCTHILCVDSDLGWPAEAVLSMLHQDKEFVGGLYPSRSDEKSFLFRASHNEDGSIVQDRHLLKMEYIPSGFMLIRRDAIQKMRDKFPHLYYKPKDPNNQDSGYCFFNTEVWEGEFWGEDYVFCRRLREAGIDIWIDPLIQFEHAGNLGMFLECLTNKDGDKLVKW